MIHAIVGANWGDEGKGKMTDMLAAQSDIVIRFQGGANAGHTILNEYGKFALHLLPSGVFYPHITNIIGPGVALNIPSFMQELNGLREHGIQPNLLVSDRAQVVLPIHPLLDSLEEARRAGKSFGSTQSGIAPFYSDKFAKIGLQVCELFDRPYLEEKIRTIVTLKNPLMEHLYHTTPIDADALIAVLLEQAEQIRPFVGDTTVFLHDALRADKNILLEGQLGALRDPDHGIYPYSTSSSTLAGNACIGAGLPPYAIREITAVVKAYSSCVGAGPFVSEIFGDEAQELRDRGGDGGEYGATTGRPRRMGWFDIPATRYGCLVQGATGVALTLIDVLGYLEKIPVCVAYEYQGKRIDSFPHTRALYECKPIIEYLPGWQCDLREVRRFEELPAAAQNYVRFVEKAIGVPVKFISNGPRREQIIRL